MDEDYEGNIVTDERQAHGRLYTEKDAETGRIKYARETVSLSVDALVYLRIINREQAAHGSKFIRLTSSIMCNSRYGTNPLYSGVEFGGEPQMGDLYVITQINRMLDAQSRAIIRLFCSDHAYEEDIFVIRKAASFYHRDRIQDAFDALGDALEKVAA